MSGGISDPDAPSPDRLPDGIVPEELVVATELRWLWVVTGILGVMVAVIVVTGITNALHPPSSGTVVDPTMVYQSGEFVESNLGTAVEPDGSATVRLIAQQYSFVPPCVTVPRGVPVTFRLTSPDVIHGFLLPDTNVNSMVVPGFVSVVHTSFDAPGDYRMPCHEFCGLGHHAMWAMVRVVPQSDFLHLASAERTSCAAQ
jgi:cytochrome c oxidase subunit II